MIKTPQTHRNECTRLQIAHALLSVLLCKYSLQAVHFYKSTVTLGRPLILSLQMPASIVERFYPDVHLIEIANVIALLMT